ncbi:MOSC N-terminal beta barrel domain-containing protein [Mariannaea sp. PMI_226]|nr:MOSC N-terminal beta barrel domain-containing protein [Mariannaea sp. PMI_226]
MISAMKDSVYNTDVEDLREGEYPMIKDSVYLDHAGATLCPKSVMDSFAIDMTSALYGNPHSASPSSQLSTSRIEDARMNLLAFLGADPSKYDLVFVSNATAGIKLVVDALRCQPHGWRYAYHQACHTSLVGARGEASDSVCLDDHGVQSWCEGVTPFDNSPQQQQLAVTLFSYSAQSHMDGKRYPLTWSQKLKRTHRNTQSQSQIYTLLDASSFCATSQLHLDDPSIIPDFVVLSLYKIFGFPDLGALLVRRSAEHLFDHRKYFGGGTVDMVVSGKEEWHATKSQFLHERLEDGTLPFHSIIALDIAMSAHQRLFGSMDQVSSHTSYLTQRLHQALSRLRHANGEPVCKIYTKISSDSPLGTGPVVSFNIRNSLGAWVSLTEFEKLANLKKMHIRTGSLCSPGCIASALNLQPWEMKRNFSAGYRCGAENDIMAGKPTGVIRASLGAMSTMADVDRFVDFIGEFYQEATLYNGGIYDCDSITEPWTSQTQAGLEVESITIYPIKSCAGFSIPPAVPWEIRPEGLAWDREWCLLHQGSGHALSQKRCPKMALLRPILDFDRGELIVKYHGTPKQGFPNQISIPLSADPSFVNTSMHQLPSRVCGDRISPQIYTSNEINTFFSRVLGIPCVLARFPPGGIGSSSRLSKAQMSRHQKPQLGIQRLPGSFPEIPSPPDSDSEQQQPSKILLSNESPILMICRSSVDALNEEIKRRGGEGVSDKAFRANIVLRRSNGLNEPPAFEEDNWGLVRVGKQTFKLLGACRRCQMVCIDQETGEKKEEPFVTLAKTRRYDGKIYFGVHMRHDLLGPHDHGSRDTQYPTIKVGELVTIEDKKTSI